MALLRLATYCAVCVGDCAAGHWCVFGVDRPNPDGNETLNDPCFDGRMMGFGGICPVGHYCPGGVNSIYPLSCQNGTYADEEGLSECKECPLGKAVVTCK